MNIAEARDLVVGHEYDTVTGVDGQMFMLEATTTDINIDSFTFKFNGGGTTEYTFKVWYKEGEFLPYRLDQSAWTLACSGSAPVGTWDIVDRVWHRPSTGECPISIPAGERVSVYIAGISRECATEKLCSGSVCTNSFEDPVSADGYLIAYTGLGVHDLFGNGNIDTYYVHPDVTVYYEVNSNKKANEMVMEDVMGATVNVNAYRWMIYVFLGSVLVLVSLFMCRLCKRTQQSEVDACTALLSKKNNM